MAECNTTQVVVSNDAGTVDTRGNYTANGTANGFTIYSKDGGTNYNQIRVSSDGGGFQWTIVFPPFPGASFSARAYQSQDFGSFGNIPTCPTDVSIVWTKTNSGSDPAPTVISGESSPDPYAPFGGFSLWRRKKIFPRIQLKLGGKRSKLK